MDENQPTPQDYVPQIFPNQPGDDLTRWRLEGGDIRDDIEHQLRGDYLKKEEVKDGEGNIAGVIEKWQSDDNARIMNESGVRRIASVATFMINKATALSNVNEEHIFKTCREIEIAISRLIYDNWNDFNVRTNPSSVIYILMELTFFHLMRAKGGGERASMTQAETTSRIIRESGQGGRRIFPFGGGGNQNEQRVQ